MTDERTPPTGSGRPPPRWILKTMTRVHVFLHRLSGGRLFNKLAGDEVCFVTMTGAKSGRRLTIPLMYVPCVVALETNVTPAGRRSVSTTPVAVFGPLFVSATV